MKVINPMTGDKFDIVCDAGVKLIDRLKHVLNTAGLDSGEAANVLAIAVGGVIRGLNISPDQFMQAIQISCQMWNQRSAGLNGVVFDPPHKRDGFVPATRDKSMEN